MSRLRQFVRHGELPDGRPLLPAYPAPAHRLENVLCAICRAQLAVGMMDDDDYWLPARPVCCSCAERVFDQWLT